MSFYFSALFIDRLDVPDILCVLSYGTVRRKSSADRGVHKSFSRMTRHITGTHFSSIIVDRLERCIDVCPQVIHNIVSVIVFQNIGKIPILPFKSRLSSLEHVDQGYKILIISQEAFMPIRSLGFLECLYIFTENVVVLCTSSCNNFDICSIQGTKGRCAVHHLLHVAGTRSFCSDSTDLFREIRTRVNLFTITYVKVSQEYNLHLIIDVRIIVYHLLNVLQKRNDFFCNRKTCSRLTANNKCSLIEIFHLTSLELLVDIENSQSIHKLTLILVNSLYLAVKNAVRINFDAFMLLNILSQANLSFVLNTSKFFQDIYVVSVIFKILKKIQIHLPTFTCILVQEQGQGFVCKVYPATLSNTVRLVVETLRIQLVPAMQSRILDNLAMHFCNTINLASYEACNPSHVNSTITEKFIRMDLIPIRYSSSLVLHLEFFLGLKFLDENPVEFLNDLEKIRKNALEMENGPLLERFAHDRMVCVSKAFLCFSECLVKRVASFFEKSNKFQTSEHRMCIVHLEDIVILNVVQGSMFSHVNAEKSL